MQCRSFHWVVLGAIVFVAATGCAGDTFASDFPHFSIMATATAIPNAGSIGQSVASWVQRLFTVSGGGISVNQTGVANLNDEITNSTGVNLVKFFQFVGSLLLKLLSWISWAIQWFLRWLPRA